ncbi:MAG TPA: organomercurial lyase [Bradyrhizobium sp.]|nr:organomercurial lyase [Bradyrhizobium sp.]
MTVVDKVPSVEAYWHSLEPHLPHFPPEEQRVAVALYRELAKGRPVDAAQLGLALGISADDARTLLDREPIKNLIYPDDQGRVLGFGGLAAVQMHHRFEVDGRVLSTWCAWDSLFIPEILGRAARITSPDPESGELVRVVAAPERIASADPPDAVVSFVLPDAEVFGTSAANVMAKFCHFIFFFSTRQSGERWVANRPGTFLYALEDAFVLAKRLNARNFGTELARRTSSTTLAQ